MMPAGRLPTDRPTDGGTEDGRRDGTERKGTNEPNDGGNERTKHPTGMNKRINRSTDSNELTRSVIVLHIDRSLAGRAGVLFRCLLVFLMAHKRTKARSIDQSVILQCVCVACSDVCVYVCRCRADPARIDAHHADDQFLTDMRASATDLSTRSSYGSACMQMKETRFMHICTCEHR